MTVSGEMTGRSAPRPTIVNEGSAIDSAVVRAHQHATARVLARRVAYQNSYHGGWVGQSAALGLTGGEVADIMQAQALIEGLSTEVVLARTVTMQMRWSGTSSPWALRRSDPAPQPPRRSARLSLPCTPRPQSGVAHLESAQIVSPCCHIIV